MHVIFRCLLPRDNDRCGDQFHEHVCRKLWLEEVSSAVWLANRDKPGPRPYFPFQNLHGLVTVVAEWQMLNGV